MMCCLQTLRRGLYFLLQELQCCRVVNVGPAYPPFTQRGVTVSWKNILRLVVALGVYGTVGHVWAYDASPNSSTTDPCNQVILSAFTPPSFSQDKNNVEVAPKSDFSFLISKTANSENITVKIKDEKVPISVTPISNGYLVKGKLPATIKGAFIRVNIFAKGPNNCDRTDGWLLKVGN